MRIHIVAVGRARAGPQRALFEHYAARLTRPFSLTLKEVEEKRPLPGPQLRHREGQLLLAQVPESAVLVALDERGVSIPSLAFADRLGGWRDDGVGDLVFLIGGADGLDPAVRQRAAQVISFGAATWPHMLVRGMLAEQIYRAGCILGGHPYHRQ